MKNTKLLQYITQFTDKNIGVVGDIMLDRYIFGNVERISPEAPVPVVQAKNEVVSPGGAANVAVGIAAFGGNAYIVSIIGDDSKGLTLTKELQKMNVKTNGIIKIPRRTTISKMRIVAHGQHMLRIDHEELKYLSSQEEELIVNYVKKNIKKWNCLILSDYAKGCLTESLTQKLIELSKAAKVFTIADPKPKNAHFFKGISLLTPNYKEACEITRMTDITKAGKYLQKELECNALITQGAEGMTLFEGKTIQHFPTQVKEVYDVVGAGDTVVATLALSIGAGASLSQATLLANYAAGVVVGKVGTASVTQKELEFTLKKNEK